MLKIKTDEVTLRALKKGKDYADKCGDPETAYWLLHLLRTLEDQAL